MTKAFMDRAVSLAALGPAHGPNPRVGCVIALPDAGEGADAILAQGHHKGTGTAHAEADALAQAAAAGISVEGATAYVTLEPCNHTGRTGPCAVALADAGIARVVYAVKDPNPTAAGGAEYLRSRGLEVEFAPHDAAQELNRRWLVAMARQRPYVIAKWASTLDGRTAAADGTSFWITGEEAREHAHQVRAAVDAIIVGTGTVAIDDPELSARPAGVAEPHQPLRLVMGERDTPGAKVWRDANAARVSSRDPSVGLEKAWERECRVVLVEGGATVTSAFLAAGLVDEVHAYIAPAILGEGPSAVSGLGIGTMADALRGRDVTVTRLGVDTLVTAVFTKET
ncbi:bifunctional diaminohydroxyphosphoribosylaminopyrimidine deaminase/5-amino-6-(5-phosphoribosylamino)uracil reductase RibD [Demequina sp.]|uniref:bifunctional diaminohydroxyphosphoribosylaminopyrimidine deaminase/5-amino-6-(5-phosphoribosylamino)uracil reductase RibD n=1 Tax=Demequina sp. TaxID=2050685 RepID=UPI003D12E606